MLRSVEKEEDDDSGGDGDGDSFAIESGPPCGKTCAAGSPKIFGLNNGLEDKIVSEMFHSMFCY